MREVSLAPFRPLLAHRAQNATLMAGLRYEARATKWLVQRYDLQPQVEFLVGSRRFRPDGLIFSPDFSRMLVVEIKTQHSLEGWNQLRWYTTWLSEWFPGKTQGVLFCQDYRPELGGVLLRNLQELLDSGDVKQGVLTVAARELPRARADGGCSGLGMGTGFADSLVWSARATGDDAVGGLRDASMAALARAAGARCDSRAYGGVE